MPQIVLGVQSIELAAENKKIVDAKFIPLPGGWTPVNPMDDHIQKIGAWAVKEHNKKAGTSLVFLAVVAGKSQTLAIGVDYKLAIAAIEAGPFPPFVQYHGPLYYAEVFEAVTGDKLLITFEPFCKEKQGK